MLSLCDVHGLAEIHPCMTISRRTQVNVILPASRYAMAVRSVVTDLQGAEAPFQYQLFDKHCVSERIRQCRLQGHVRTSACCMVYEV